MVWRRWCQEALETLYAGKYHSVETSHLGEMIRVAADFSMPPDSIVGRCCDLIRILVRNVDKHTPKNFRVLLQFVLRNGPDPYTFSPNGYMSFFEHLEMRSQHEDYGFLQQDIAVFVDRRRRSVRCLLVPVFGVEGIAVITADYVL